MPLEEQTKIWLKGLISAAMGGAAGSLGLFAVAHETPFATLVKAGAIGAVISVAGYLKQSPLP